MTGSSNSLGSTLTCTWAAHLPLLHCAFDSQSAQAGVVLTRPSDPHTATIGILVISSKELHPAFFALGLFGSNTCQSTITVIYCFAYDEFFFDFRISPTFQRKKSRGQSNILIIGNIKIFTLVGQLVKGVGSGVWWTKSRTMGRLGRVLIHSAERRSRQRKRD